MSGIASGGLMGMAAGLATEAQAIDAAPGPTPFSRQTLKSLAEALSRAPFRKPTFDLPPALKKIYDTLGFSVKEIDEAMIEEDLA